MVADRPARGRRGERRRLHSRADDDRARPRACAARGAGRRARASSRASSRRASSTSATTSARSATTSRLQYEYEAIYCIVDYHALTSTHDAGRAARADARDGRVACSRSASTRSAARCSSRATGPEHTELAWLLATVTPVSWLERTPTYKEKKREPARRHQPRAADLPGPAGRRHRHLQGVARAGRQGPGRPPRAVARDRPRLQPPLRRHVPRAAGGLHRGARSSSAPTASGR